MPDPISFSVNERGDFIATNTDPGYGYLALYLHVELKKPVYCDNILRWIARFENGDGSSEAESGNLLYMLLHGEMAEIGEPFTFNGIEMVPGEYPINEVKDLIARWKAFLLESHRT